MKKKKWFIGVFILLLGVMVMSPRKDTLAATDKTAPSVSVKQESTKPTNGKVKIIIKAIDTSGISLVKWASGSKNSTYFKTYGKKITLTSSHTAAVWVSKNGIYSFYVKDKAGNINLKKITISNMDTSVPSYTITKSTTKATNKSVKLTLKITEDGLGLTSIKYLTGKKYEEDFTDAGKMLTFTKDSVSKSGTYSHTYLYTAVLTVKSNNYYTFLVTDAAGNKLLKRVSIQNIDKTAPVIKLTPNKTTPTNTAVSVTVAASDAGSGMNQVFYLPGTKESADFSVSDTNTTETENSEPVTIQLDEAGIGSFQVTKNGTYSVLATDNAGNQTLQTITISNIDQTVPTLSLNYSVMNQVATITYKATDKNSGVSSVIYVKGKVTDRNSDSWETKGKDITSSNNFHVNTTGNYTVLVEDKAGNKTISTIHVEMEFRAVWISYLEFLSYGKMGYSEDNFKSFIDTMFDNVVDLNMTAVIVQVRPYGDALYDSSYFPWSKYISGTQGKDPGFDPLEYMVDAAHNRGLEFHAWLNPYRVTTASTDYSKLSADNPAKKWHEDSDKTNDRNVLSFGGSLYYNPASKTVQNLITNGVKEIVSNYDVDGIHFDDYFYPSLGTDYATKFDYVEYNTYAAACKEGGKTPLSIANWRRNNVNTLVKNIYKSIKSIDSTVQFGISPGGFLDKLQTDTGYYVDIKTWLSSSSYIDYICPQIYWGFTEKAYPFDTTLDRWLALRTSKTVHMYVGIANYKAGSSLTEEWKNDDEILAKQVEYGRNTGLVDGFLFFRYNFFYDPTTEAATEQLLGVLD